MFIITPDEIFSLSERLEGKEIELLSRLWKICTDTNQKYNRYWRSDWMELQVDGDDCGLFDSLENSGVIEVAKIKNKPDAILVRINDLAIRNMLDGYA